MFCINKTGKKLILLSCILAVGSPLNSAIAEDKVNETTDKDKTAAPLFPWAQKTEDDKDSSDKEPAKDPESPDDDNDDDEDPENKKPKSKPAPPPPPQAKQEDDPEKARKFKAQLHAFEAGKLMKQKAYIYAAREFKAAANLEPENLQYVLGYANAAHQAHDWNEAVQAYERLLKADPKQTDVHKTMAECLHKLGRYDEAVAEYKKSVAYEKDKAEIWRRIATIRTTQSKHDEAMEAYRQATKADPADGKSYKNLAAIQWQAGNKAAAMATYKEGVRNNPRDADLYGAYAYALMTNQQWQEAANAYQAAAKINGTTPQLDQGYRSAMEHVNYENEMAKRKEEAEKRKAAKLHPLRK